MMLLACLLPLLVSVSAYSPRWPIEQQRSGLELPETVSAAIANEIASLNIDPTVPFSRIQPETAWIAVQKIVSTVVPTVIPESCGETFALQAFLGFGRHYWHELLEQNLLRAVEECKDLAHISRIEKSAVRGPTPMEKVNLMTGFPETVESLTGFPEQQPIDVLTGFPEQTIETLTGYPETVESVSGPYSSLYAGQRWETLANEMTGKFARGLRGEGINTPSFEQIKEIERAVMSELDRKMATISGNTDFMLMAKFFKSLKNLIDVEGAKNKTVGEVLQKVSILCQKELPIATRTCDVSRSLINAQPAILDVISFMKRDFISVIESSLTSSPLAKAILINKMQITMPKFANCLMVILRAYEPSNTSDFVGRVLLGQVKQHVEIVHIVSEMIGNFVENETVYKLATAMVQEGKTKPLLKILLRTCAMQMVKIGMHPQQIDIVLSNMLWSLKVSGSELSSYGGLYNPSGRLYTPRLYRTAY